MNAHHATMTAVCLASGMYGFWDVCHYKERFSCTVEQSLIDWQQHMPLLSTEHLTITVCCQKDVCLCHDVCTSLTQCRLQQQRQRQQLTVTRAYFRVCLFARPYYGDYRRPDRDYPRYGREYPNEDSAGRGRTCLYLGTERLGVMFVYDITNPYKPVFQSFAKPPVNSGGASLAAPEGVQYTRYAFSACSVTKCAVSCVRLSQRVAHSFHSKLLISMDDVASLLLSADAICQLKTVFVGHTWTMLWGPPQ